MLLLLLLSLLLLLLFLLQFSFEIREKGGRGEGGREPPYEKVKDARRKF